MRMQDVAFELIYEPGKDDADPFDSLSRHPSPEKGKDAVERVIKYVLNVEHVVVVDQIKEETHKDTQLQKLSFRIYLPGTGSITKRIQPLHHSTLCRMSCMQCGMDYSSE